MTNAQDVFDAAMTLIDEVNEQTGKTDTPDTQEYKSKSLTLINILAGELYKYSDTYTQSSAGIRPVLSPIRSFTQNLNLDDYICRTVLPYGLAALLYINEDPAMANFFQQKFDELKNELKSGFPVESTDIVDVYGGLEPYQDFGEW